jgi:Zn-dependent peptidase ImmA (M78 family)
MNTSDINLKNAKSILEWCEKNLGKSKTRKNSNLSISITRSIKFKGLYEEDKEYSRIYINPDRHRSFNEFIDTVIHEYTHFLQGLKYYDAILEITGYEKHPMEHSSNMIADLLKRKCRKDLFSW